MAMSLREARTIGEPVVYGLADAEGAIAYVGMTRRPRGRFSAYRCPKRGHNPQQQQISKITEIHHECTLPARISSSPEQLNP